jgi:hypothetical protein
MDEPTKVLQALKDEIGLHEWEEATLDGVRTKIREPSRIAMLEYQVRELFERAKRAEATIAALESFIIARLE